MAVTAEQPTRRPLDSRPSEPLASLPLLSLANVRHTTDDGAAVPPPLMTKHWRLPGHVEHIAGFDACRARSSKTYAAARPDGGGGRSWRWLRRSTGIYSSTVYVTPFLLVGRSSTGAVANRARSSGRLP